jgi:hypothetical protein|nr:MAG TPA: hypothetical protein [Caudoviricetes sp.]
MLSLVTPVTYGSKLSRSSLVVAVHTSSAQFFKTSVSTASESATLRLLIFASKNRYAFDATASLLYSSILLKTVVHCASDFLSW